MVRKRDSKLHQTNANSDGYKKATAGATPATFDQSMYSDWRKSELIQQFNDYFSAGDVSGKRVLDFGCGTGELAFHISHLGAAEIVGIDLNEEAITSGEQRAAKEHLPIIPYFMTGDPNKIPLSDGACDLVLCFDVLEHIYEPEAILKEWKRVLSDKGKIFIWWQPYYHPYGNHLMAYMPIPWAHALFSDKTLAVACKRIFDMPEYVPRYWDLDSNGNKKNKQFGGKYLGGVNRLTIAEFERLCESASLQIQRREAHSFVGSWIVEKVSSICTRIPLLKEYFTAYMIYEIGKKH